MKEKKTLNGYIALMQYVTSRIVFTCILVMLLCFVRLNVGSTDGADGSVIRVPGDYATIAWAVGNATNGDTILVASGVYVENVVVDKPLKIAGEATNTTVVDGGGYAWNNKTKGFHVISDNVSIENLTVRNAYSGIFVENADNFTLQNTLSVLGIHGANVAECHRAEIRGNIASNNSFGVFIINSLNCIVENNTVTDNYGGYPDLRVGGGIHLVHTNHSIASRNFATRNLVGINVEGCSNTTITENIAVNNSEPVYGWGSGIEIYGSEDCAIANNTVAVQGIGLSRCSHCLVTDNLVPGSGSIFGFENLFFRNIISGGYLGLGMEQTQDFFVGNLITNCSQGINIHYSNGSTFYHNMLINNPLHFPKDVYANFNAFDNGFEGNYWDNYTGVDADQDGIGDTPHQLDDYNMDNHPLMAPINIFDAGVWNGTEQQINVVSNSTMTNFQLNPSANTISFNVTGEAPTAGFCRITIPNVIAEQLWSNNYTILIDNMEPTFTKNWTDATSTYIYLTYQHSTHEITIIPEHLLHTLFAAIALSTLIQAIVKRLPKTR